MVQFNYLLNITILDFSLLILLNLLHLIFFASFLCLVFFLCCSLYSYRSYSYRDSESCCFFSDETELRAFFVAITLPFLLFHKIEMRESAGMKTKKLTEFRIIFFSFIEEIAKSLHSLFNISFKKKKGDNYYLLMQ